MSSRGGTKRELHQVVPREQVGARTGDAFEFQYHQAAADALKVLDETEVACVYCEWHDDYVVESAGVVSYAFHQVKSRKASKGPWTLNEFFGIARSPGRKPKNGPNKSAPAKEDSIFGRLLDHVEKFGERCGWFVFVTDAGIASDFEKLLDAVQLTDDLAELPEAFRRVFDSLYSPLVSTFASLSEEGLHRFLKRLSVREAVGKLGDLKSCRTLIGGRIHEMSEVDLTISETQKIGADLVFAVRERSHRVLPKLPTTTVELRQLKGLVLDDVLQILSLSGPGYRELQASGRQAVVALSRLHRLCKRSQIPDTLIPHFCRLKTSWEVWWVSQRHLVNELDVIALKKSCADALRMHVSGTLNFSELRTKAKALAAKYDPVLTSPERLTEELVFGLMLALAVEAEA